MSSQHINSKYRDMCRRSDILALVLTGLAIITLCEVVVIVVEPLQGYQAQQYLAPHHVQRHESGHYIHTRSRSDDYLRAL